MDANGTVGATCRGLIKAEASPMRTCCLDHDADREEGREKEIEIEKRVGKDTKRNAIVLLHGAGCVGASGGHIFT